MKTIKILSITILLSITLGITSCKDFLEEEPKSFLAPQNFFKNADDAYAALINVYDALSRNQFGLYNRRLPYLLFFCSDECLPPRALVTEQLLDNYTYTADDINITSIWISMYDVINSANVVIDRLPAITMDENLKQQYIGEARFLRALNYFNGVRLWGALPLMTQETTNIEQAQVPRSPVNEVYKVIIDDLNFAIANIKPANQKGRATSGAAKGLLAKVYLTKASSEAAEPSDYQKCADLAKEVIEMPQHALMPVYQMAIGAEDEHNLESLFEVQADRVLSPLAELSVLGIFTLPRDIFGFIPEPGQSGNSDIVSEIPYFNLYEEGDYRKEATFITQGLNKKGEVVSWQQFPFPYPHPAWKYVHQNATTRSEYAFSGNFFVLRLSDVYLMRAEALNEINGPTPEAYAMINAIRARARNANGTTPSLIPADLASLSKEEFRDAVLHERAVELGFEGHRWFDLVRTKTLVQTIKAIHPEYPVSDKHLLFPIPDNQLVLNKNLEQNEAWK